MTDEVNVEVEETATDAPRPVSMKDLLILAQTVAVCSSRGAIRPDEFTVVGAAYDRLIALLRASGQISEGTNLNTVDNKVDKDVDNKVDVDEDVDEDIVKDVVKVDEDVVKVDVGIGSMTPNGRK